MTEDAEITRLTRLAELMRLHGLTRLEYERDGVRVALERDLRDAAPAVPPASAKELAAPRALPDDGGTLVTSPLVGIAYRAREPGAPPLAEVGQAVKRGDALCVVEAMKLFNEIPAPCDGTILAVHFEDGGLAEFGAPLVTLG